MAVAYNYHRVQEEIATAAQRCGRDPADILLVAVSKGHNWEQVQPAYEAGCRNFGENRLQEALPKISEAPQDVQWHFIGTLQKNKVVKVIHNFSLIHSVDNLELAQKISECSSELGKTTRILLEVNTSGEPTKHGLNTEQWSQVFDTVLALPGIRLEGLMTMAPLTDDEKRIGKCFADLRIFRERLALRAGDKASLQHLSMGMSHDYPLAIAEGATIVRIGTAIFKS